MDVPESVKKLSINDLIHICDIMDLTLKAGIKHSRIFMEQHDLTWEEMKIACSIAKRLDK